MGPCCFQQKFTTIFDQVSPCSSYNFSLRSLHTELTHHPPAFLSFAITDHNFTKMFQRETYVNLFLLLVLGLSIVPCRWMVMHFCVQDAICMAYVEALEQLDDDVDRWSRLAVASFRCVWNEEGQRYQCISMMVWRDAAGWQRKVQECVQRWRSKTSKQLDNAAGSWSRLALANFVIVGFRSVCLTHLEDFWESHRH